MPDDDDDRDLATLLSQLKAEIEDAQRGDLDEGELRRLLDAVERHLDPEEDDDDGLAEELEESVVRWESSHPRLAESLRRVADALGGIGL